MSIQKRLEAIESKIPYTRIGLKPNTLMPDRTIPEPIREPDFRWLLNLAKRQAEVIEKLTSGLELYATDSGENYTNDADEVLAECKKLMDNFSTD